ncbi:Detected protein of unknown function [Hibiscus syriacus]|uniref:Integrase catalytic domain-containing protein n=1 Tax=Hibiscus syriacus TaxID=106335 RepID=A0A6A2YQ52_HIBSY|nr:Detected protein of unknown function [Hibiscus syriacus]
MSSFPKLGSLSAIVDRQDTESQVEMGSLQVLNALKAKSLTLSLSNGLIYVEAVINEKLTRAMVDMGASHNFVSKDEANRLGLKYSMSKGWLKTVVLGLDFLRQVTAISMHSFSSVCILEKGSRCMIPKVEAPKEQGRDAKQLSAIQLGRGIKQGAMTYLAMLKEDVEIEKTDNLPLIIRKVLGENNDVMPPELRNKLPPRRETNNVATSYFQTQKKLSPKQARWKDFLAEFDYILEYKPGKANVVADALSRTAELVAISLAKGTVLERIKEGLEQDPMTRELVKLASDGKTQRFWVEDGLLYTKGRRIYVPKWNNLRRDLIKECHDTKWAGHPGQKRTMALLETTYFWPHMKDSVELYVKICLVCQQDKVENRQPAGLLEPLPVPQRPWDSIALDFISALPKSERYDLIMVVVDRFSKYGTFIPCPKDCIAEEAARAFFKNFVKHWGLPRSIISDRDPRFTGRLWMKLFKLLGTELNFSTSFHPQTDGQTEWVNALLECYLRHFVLAKVGKVSYRLDLPSTLEIHPVFYVSMLKTYHADKEDPSRGYSHRAPPVVTSRGYSHRAPHVVTKSYDKEVETVLTSRTVRKRGVPPRTKYLIKWKDLPESEVTWELAEDLWQFEEHLKAYETTRMTPK